VPKRADAARMVNRPNPRNEAISRHTPRARHRVPLYAGDIFTTLLTGASTHTLAWAPSTDSADESPAPVPHTRRICSQLAPRPRGTRSPQYGRGLRGRLERHVQPRLGERPLDEIDVDDILALISDLRKQGYSGATVTATLTRFHGCSRIRCAAA
jgi:hypothetical protein